MKRLTKKCKDENGRFYAPNTDDVGEAMENVIFQKLGKLEDLEEQIGMPLDIFVNVLTNGIGIWYIDGNNIISYCIDGFKNGVFYAEDYCRGCRMDDILFNPADYGIVWFLTYEEAEKKLEEMKNAN